MCAIDGVTRAAPQALGLPVKMLWVAEPLVENLKSQTLVYITVPQAPFFFCDKINMFFSDDHTKIIEVGKNPEMLPERAA